MIGGMRCLKALFGLFCNYQNIENVCREVGFDRMPCNWASFSGFKSGKRVSLINGSYPKCHGVYFSFPNCKEKGWNWLNKIHCQKKLIAVDFDEFQNL